MSTIPPAQPEPRFRYWIPLVVLIAAFALTALATLFVQRAARMRDETRFQSAVDQTRNLIEHQTRTYVGLLQGGAGLFAASEEVIAEEFQAYIARLDIKRHYKGVQGLGYSARIPPGQAVATRERMRRFHENFRFWADDPNAELHSIIYLEPLDDLNKRAVGYNMYSESVRRRAMAQARDTGLPAASGKVRLKQEGTEGRQAGFLVYVPVYHGGLVPQTVEERRKALLGFVYSPFRIDDFIHGIFESEDRPLVSFDIWDGSSRSPNSLLFTGLEQQGPPHSRPFSSNVAVKVLGRTWSLHAEPTPEFHVTSGRDVVPVTLIGGLAISALLFGITMVQARSRMAAERTAEALRRSRDAAERAAEDLRRSEARSRRLLESNIIGVVYEQLDGTITEANESFLDMLGYTREDMAGGRLCWNSLTPPGYEDRDAAAVKELRRSGKHDPYEKDLLRADGTRVPVLIGAARLEHGSDLSVGYTVDLTELKRAEEAVRASQVELERLYNEAQAARAAAEEANRLKDEFLATVSHELRTPLNAIVGYTQLLRMGRRDPQDTNRALEAIERNVKAQAQLIGDLLDVSRIVSGKLRLDVERVDLEKVIHAAVESVALAASAREIALEISVAPDVEPVSGDPARLQQVVWNLLSNAIKFTGPGGRVCVIASQVDSLAEIAVRDTGSGISPGFLPHIFDRFRQLDSSTTRRHVGLGLGLSIVRNIVEMHGGHVHAESEGEGKGAAFIVHLPLSAPEVAPDGRPAPPAVSMSHRPASEGEIDRRALNGLRVLVVDDEADARDMMRDILGEYGAEVRVESSVSAALTALAEFHPHVLLSDIAMPGEDGYSLIRRIRALEPDQGGAVPAAALTAFAREQDRHRALMAGFEVHIAKPVEPADLIRTVARLAGRDAHADGNAD